MLIPVRRVAQIWECSTETIMHRVHRGAAPQPVQSEPYLWDEEQVKAALVGRDPQGKARRLTPEEVEDIKSLLLEGFAVGEVARRLGVSRQTVYRHRP